MRNVPKIIECGESVCHTCTQTIVNNLSADATEFNCPICGEIHGLPQYRVFKNNKFLLKILKLPYLPAIPKEEGVNKEELDSTIETKPVNETLTKPAEEPEIVPEPEIAPEPEAFIESNAETDLNEVSESGALPAEEVFTVPIPPPLPELDFFKIQLPSSKPEVAVELEKEALTEPTEEPEVFTLSIPSKKPEPEILEEPEEITAPLPPPKNKKKMIKLKSIDTCDIMVDQAMKPSSSSSGGGASKLQQLETILTTKGLDKVLEYCEDMRIDIQWCVELGVGTIQEKSESLLVKIDEFEAECTKNLGILSLEILPIGILMLILIKLVVSGLNFLIFKISIFTCLITLVIGKKFDNF